MNLPKTLLRHFKPLIILVFGTLTAIGPDSSAAEPASPPPPVSKAKEPLPAPTHANVSYGPHTDHKIDLWLAKSSRPTPLILFIHGGGFVSGDKNRVSASAVREALDDGVSFASINYRFLFDASINEILRDTARALQFVRARAGDYNLDKRIAVYGSSAGAGASLWLAFHDELSDPNNADPVLRESSRVTAAASLAGQATYDLLRWPEVLGEKEALRVYPQAELALFYGLNTREDLQTDKGKALRADADILALLSSDDPPVWLGADAARGAHANRNDINHSPKHSEALKKRADEVGVRAILQLTNASAIAGERRITPIAFLLRQLGPRLP